MLARASAAALLAVLLVGAVAVPASAHASLVGTDPAEGAVLPEAPAEVTFTFDEPVSVVDNGVSAYDASGAPLEVDAAAQDEVVTAELPGDLDDGTYVVVWRVVSSDGHPIAGSLTFHVGAPSEEVVPPEVAAEGSGSMRSVASVVQAVSYVGLLLCVGLVVFLGWTLRGIRVRDTIRRRLVLVLRCAGAVAVLASAVAVPVAGAYQRGVGPGGLLEWATYDLDLVSGDLIVLAHQAIGLGLACVLVGRPRDERTPPPSLADVGAAFAVWSPALVGHTRAYEPASLLVLTDALHLTAGAVWFGGLVGLALTLPSVAGREREGARLLSRFSTVAAGLLLVVAAAGVVLGWRILGSWSGLVDTTYGRLLLVKVGLALVVVALAAWNRFRLLPRVADGPHDARRATAYVVRRTAGAEALVLVALLGVTGFLVEQPPRAEQTTAPVAGGSGVAVATAGDHRVLVLLTGEGTRRTLQLQVQDETGEPVDVAGSPEVSVRSGGSEGGDTVDLGQVPVQPVGAGTYSGDVTLPTPGEWEVQVSLPVSEFDNPVTTLTVDAG